MEEDFIVEDNKGQAQTGHVRITIDIECFDPNVLTQMANELIKVAAQLNPTLQSPIVLKLVTGKGGRRPLSEREWEKRFEAVERILEASEESGITLEQACAREGIPYSTFRHWRQKM
jgi:hypothetical protein